MCVYSFKPNKPRFTKFTNKKVDILCIHFNINDIEIDKFKLHKTNDHNLVEAHHLLTQPIINILLSTDKSILWTYKNNTSHIHFNTST